MPDFPYPLAIPNYDRTTIKGCLESLGIDADKRLEEVKEDLVECYVSDSLCSYGYDGSEISKFGCGLPKRKFFKLTHADVQKIIKYEIDLSTEEGVAYPETPDHIELSYCNLVEILGFLPDFPFDADYFKNYSDINHKDFRLVFFVNDFIAKTANILDYNAYDNVVQNAFLKKMYDLEFEFVSLPSSFDVAYFLKKSLKHYYTFEDFFDKADLTDGYVIHFVLNSIVPSPYLHVGNWSGLNSLDYQRLVALHNDRSNFDENKNLIAGRADEENPLMIYYLHRIQEFFTSSLKDFSPTLNNDIIGHSFGNNLNEKTMDFYVNFVSLLTDIEHYGRFLETQQNDTPPITLGF